MTHTHSARWVLLACVSLAIAVASLGCAARHRLERRAGDENTATLPHDLRVAMDRATSIYPEPLKGATWSRFEILKGQEDSCLQLHGTNGRGRTIEVEVTRSGRVIEIEEFGVPLHEVPAAVMEGLKVKIPFANPEWAIAIYQGGQPRPLVYGFGGRDAEGNTVEVYISTDGKTVLN